MNKDLESTGPHFFYDKSADLYFVKDDLDREAVFVSDRKRLSLYRAGIESRLNRLLRDYCLPRELFRSSDLVIDIGANVGELGIIVNRCGGKYIAYEPDPNAYKALIRNAEGALFQVALSDKCETKNFYLDTANADSSLFRPTHFQQVISVDTIRLDVHLHNNSMGVDKIRLLKVEAEGMEAEVLSGASKSLLKTDYLAVDAGPERGGRSTLPEVLKVLREFDFELIDCFLTRGTFLFASKSLA